MAVKTRLCMFSSIMVSSVRNHIVKVRIGMVENMAKKKRLYDLLQPCQEEEEVKSEFAKFFKIKYNTRHRIDLYTPQILFEFKLDQNFSSKTVRAKAVAQTLYYVRRLKYGATLDPVPSTICIVDKNEGFFLHTVDYKSFYEASRKYDWDRAPSQPCPKLVEALRTSDLIAKIHVYAFENEQEEQIFSDSIAVYTQESLVGYEKKVINEDNFIAVYEHWAKFFEKYVKNGHKPSEYFVSDIEAGRSEKLGTSSEVLFHLNDGTVSKSIPIDDYNYFWNIYEKVDRPDELRAIRQKMDRLSEDYQRRFTGEFYTPIEFADKAFDYILRTVGPERYKNGKWRIWDMAAGTGNLEFMLPSSVLQYCYISTLLEDDAAYCKRIFPSATVFQYDYLNDDTYLIHDEGSIPFGITPKMPRKLLNDLKDPDISWIIFINPPFVTSNKTGNELGKKSKDDVSMTYVRDIMTEQGLGETSRELFSQFLYRISVEFKGKNAYLGLFSKLKYLNSNNDQALRDKVFHYKFERGFMLHSKCFHGNRASFPVGFLVWNLGKSKSLEDQRIILDVYDDDCQKYGTKEIPTKERDCFLNKWPQRPRTTHVFPPLSSAITVSQRTNDVRNRVADSFLCSLMCCGNDMQHANNVAILSGPYCSAGAYSVVPENFERSMILHAARRLPKQSWDNDRDQFYQPFKDNLSEEFVSDCVVWSSFAPSNNTVSMRNVEYQGTIYQIENQLFPFLLKEVRSWDCGLPDLKAQLFTANEDRFLAKWLRSHSLSPEAQAVLSSAKALYRCVYKNLGNVRWLDYKIGLWDIGWWQIKSAAKSIPEAEDLLSDLKNGMAVLGNKLLIQLPALGFIPPAVQPLDE